MVKKLIKNLFFIFIFFFIFYFDSSVFALSPIKTSFGSFPVFPFDSKEFMIIQNKNDSSKTFLYLAENGQNQSCVYDRFYTNSRSYMNIGISSTSGTGCGYVLYRLVNNSWQWQRSVSIGQVFTGSVSGSYNDYNIATTLDFKYNNQDILVSAFSNLNSYIDVQFEQGEAILKGSSGNIINLVSFYFDFPNNYNVDDFSYCYKDSFTSENICFKPDYYDGGISFNNKIYYYYTNVPLYYNTTLNLDIIDLSDNYSIFKRSYNAYLSSLSSLSGFKMYDFKNYEFANLSGINSGLFGISSQLDSNITINVVNYSDNSKISFLNSSYYDSSNSYIDNTGIHWYSFNFNNDNVYLEFINNANNDDNFYLYINNYKLYLYFPTSAYVHLSGQPNSLAVQETSENQQSYKDNNGNVHFINNDVVVSDSDSEFLSRFNSFFSDINNTNFGLNAIISSPLNLIKNLLSNSCSSISLPLPYVSGNIVLPCMSQIYSQYFGNFFDIYQMITFGFISYWVVVRFLNLIKDFRNPEHDEIEVLDL